MFSFTMSRFQVGLSGLPWPAGSSLVCSHRTPSPGPPGHETHSALQPLKTTTQDHPKEKVMRAQKHVYAGGGGRQGPLGKPHLALTPGGL